MPLVHDYAVTVSAFTPTVLVSCSATLTTGSTGVLPSATTADALVTTGAASPLTTGFGRVIDRIGAPLGAFYGVAMPQAILESTLGSTEVNRAILIGCYIQHGDSSGAGDMAALSTAEQPADKQYFSTARTTDQVSWESGDRSTGVARVSSLPAYYDLKGAKRYIRLAVRVGLPGRTATTESTAEERSRVYGTITFLGAQHIGAPGSYGVDRFSPYSTSTSTN